jgi:hypothetical protein
MLFPFNLLIKWTVIVDSIIEVIAIIVIIFNDIFVTTVVPDEDHVPGLKNPCGNVPWLSFAPCRYQPLSRTWLVIFLPERGPSEKLLGVANVFLR